MNVDIKIEGNSSQETHIVTQNQESILRVAAVVNSAIEAYSAIESLHLKR